MWRTVAVGAALALGGVVLAQGSGEAEVGEAMSEIVAMLPDVQCGAPEVFELSGDSRGAARALLAKVEERGWSVMDHGMTPHSYAVIIDPNPNDPQALAVGGLLMVELQPGSSTAFLAECQITSSNSGAGYYTWVPAGEVAVR